MIRGACPGRRGGLSQADPLPTQEGKERVGVAMATNSDPGRDTAHVRHDFRGPSRLVKGLASETRWREGGVGGGGGGGGGVC